MESVYHYTSICKNCEPILSKILLADRINFRATYFEKFLQNDYMWIKEYSETIIKKICEEQGELYQEDFFDTLPYIISFCKNGNSDYMWEKYGNKGHGIMLEFDKNALLQYHHYFNEGGRLCEDLDCFCHCLYINDTLGAPNISEIKQSILQYADNIKDHEKWDFQQRLRLAVAAIKKKNPFQNEDEWRYLNLYPVVFDMEYDPNCEDCCKISDPHVSEDEVYKYITFPKEALVSITIGSEVDDYCFQCVKNYVVKCGYHPNIVKKKHKVCAKASNPSITIINNISQSQSSITIL